jgi:hypothetical protein
MMREPSYGVSVAADMSSLIWGGEGITIALLYVSLLAAIMVPLDLQLVVGSSLGQV